MAKAPVEKFRKDYKGPDYWVHEVELVVKIFDESAQVGRGETRRHECVLSGQDV
jgi:hypothetical protein